MSLSEMLFGDGMNGRNGSFDNQICSFESHNGTRFFSEPQAQPNLYAVLVLAVGWIPHKNKFAKSRA